MKESRYVIMIKVLRDEMEGGKVPLALGLQSQFQILHNA
jgi:hypothetical protein